MLSIVTRCAVLRGSRVLCTLPLRALSTIKPKIAEQKQNSVLNVTSKLPMVRSSETIFVV